MASLAAAQLLPQPPHGEGIDEAPEALELPERFRSPKDLAEDLLRDVFGLGFRAKDTLGRHEDHGSEATPGLGDSPLLSSDEAGCQIAIAGVARELRRRPATGEAWNEELASRLAIF